MDIPLKLSFIFAQDQTNGYIINIEGNNVYLDFTKTEVSLGVQIEVARPGGIMIHPVTNEEIKKKDETIAILEIVDVQDSYSVSTVYPVDAILKFSKGMEVSISNQSNKILNSEIKRSIAVQPLNVTSATGGYIGIYICDLP